MLAKDYQWELPAVLAHELAHLRSGDLLWMGMVELVRALLWFHPLAWRIKTAHGAACEAVCDAVAADYVGNPQDYSRTLSRVALELAGRPAPMAGLPMARSARIRQRLDQLKRRLYILPLARRWVMTTLALGTLTLIAIAVCKPGYAKTESASDPAQTASPPRDQAAPISSSEIKARLEQNLPNLDLEETSLGIALLHLAKIAKIPIDLPSGIDAPITVKIRNKSVRETLDLMLRMNGFSWEIQEGKIVVSKDTVLLSRIYTPDPESTTKVLQLIEDEFDRRDETSSSIEISGREMKYDPEKNTLIVTGSGEDHLRVLRILKDQRTRGTSRPSSSRRRSAQRTVSRADLMPSSAVADSTPQVLLEMLVVDSSKVELGKAPMGPTLEDVLLPEQFQGRKESLLNRGLLLSAPKVLTLSEMEAAIKTEGQGRQYKITLTPRVRDNDEIDLDVHFMLTQGSSLEETPPKEGVSGGRGFFSQVRTKSGYAVELYFEKNGTRQTVLLVKAEIIRE